MTFEEVHPVKDAIEYVVLYKGDLKVTAETAQLDGMLREGWLRGSVDDLTGLVAEIAVLARQVAEGIAAFVQDVQKDGHIDTHDGATYASSLTARRLLDDRIETLLQIVHAVYPMRQDTSVSMLDEDGTAHEIDPNQVEEHEARGFKKAS